MVPVFVFMIPIIYQYYCIWMYMASFSDVFLGIVGLVSPLIWVVSCNPDDHSATWRQILNSCKVLKYDVLATFSASTYPVSTSWDIPFKEASQRILTPSHEAADLPIAPPNRSDTACHNIKLMRKQGHVEENIRKQDRIMSENLESQQVASWWLQGFPDNYLKEGRRHFAEKPSITHLIAGKPAQVKGLSADSDVNHTGRARSL